MTEHLAGFVKRLHEAGHPPQKIYDALVTRITTKQARRLVYNATGTVIRRRTCVVTDETRAKLSVARKARAPTKLSRDTRKKISRSRRGQTQSIEAREKIAAARQQKLAEERASLPPRVCVRAECGNTFQPTVPHSLYCSPTCKRLTINAKSAERQRLRRSHIKRYSILRTTATPIAATPQHLAKTPLPPRVCARTGCGATYQPLFPHARYCSPECRNIEKRTKREQRRRERVLTCVAE
jgi:hypothetical protein